MSNIDHPGPEEFVAWVEFLERSEEPPPFFTEEQPIPNRKES